ncbi:MAG: hypothetical protein IVW57_02970, partial [Ktedonobacterales bacterium]|nr:hypothetical protein [Ktedonobacterales bacterium]
EDGRGELLNGRLDYDNADNVARFLLASGLGVPRYDPRTLAKGLRLLPGDPAARMAPSAEGHDTHVVEAKGARVYLARTAEGAARAWQADRATVYTYLHAGHTNLALHAMLRKAVDLAMSTDALPPAFLDMTDRAALHLLRGVAEGGVARLVERVCQGQPYACVWEAELPREVPDHTPWRRHPEWRVRRALEAHLAAEAALAPHEVIVEAITSSARRALPPIAPPSHPGALVWDEVPSDAQRILHVFAPAEIARDYTRRLRMAAERHFTRLGALPRADVG